MSSFRTREARSGTEDKRHWRGSAVWSVAEICTAIEDERAIARHPILARVARADGLDGRLHVAIEPLHDQFNRTIDEALEGARAWWPSEPPASAEVYAVDPDDSSILLKELTGPRPKAGDTISIYEPDFLRPLAELWATPSVAEQALGALSNVSPSSVEAPTIAALDLGVLRSSQRRALSLPRHSVSLLWGPPGTGKTTTLGAIVAEELVSGASRRVLVLATTHTAVDEAVLSVDRFLGEAGQTSLRNRVCRFGSRVDPKFFVGREHLLPSPDKEAFQQLTGLLGQEPRKGDLEKWADWKDKVDALRARLRMAVSEILKRSACVGMTVTSALYWFQAVHDAEPDLVIVDEASQLSGPAASMVAVVGKRILFAGDPKQLSAVVRTKGPRSRRILGATAFSIAPDAPQVLLEEQSRMAAPICAIVSKVFYDGKLIVAKDKAKDSAWLKERSPCWIDGQEQKQVDIRETKGVRTWSHKYRGPIRHDSAQAILGLIDAMLGSNVDPKDIVVLTPFRAQRAMLRAMLGARRAKGVQVSTVHRAQGSERAIVIFDPVDGSGEFLCGEEGNRLINVAISRAKAQVVMFLSQADRQNRTLRRIYELARAPEDIGAVSSGVALRLKEFVGRKDFPACLRGKVVQVAGTTGEVVALEKNGAVIVIACRETGNHRKFATEFALSAD